MHAAGACVGAIEYGFRWAELLRCSFLRIQPLTWYPVGSGGSLRLGTPQGTHGVLTGTPSAPAAACAEPSYGSAARFGACGGSRAVPIVGGMARPTCRAWLPEPAVGRASQYSRSLAQQ